MPGNSTLKQNLTDDEIVCQIFDLITKSYWRKDPEGGKFQFSGLAFQLRPRQMKTKNETRHVRCFIAVSEAAYQFCKKNCPNKINEEGHYIAWLHNFGSHLVREHAVPTDVIYKKYINLGTRYLNGELTEDELKQDIRDNLIHNLHMALITKEEDKLLTDSKLRSTVPLSSDFDCDSRYESVNIKMHKWEQ